MGKLEEYIGARLKTLRQAKALTIEDMAAPLGVSELQLAAIEMGKQPLKPEQLILACAQLGITIEEFMQGV